MLRAYDRPLERVLSFKYLGRLLTETKDYWPEVIVNLQKARNIWSQLDQILGREGADTRTLGNFLVTVVQAILLFRLETWVVTHHIKWILGGLHSRVALRISGKMPRRWTDGI